jgi:uncharacterized protein YjbI with pentapeptide repeats
MSNIGSRTQLQGSDLRGAILTGAIFTGAEYDERTKFPSGFNPTANDLMHIGKVT